MTFVKGSQFCNKNLLTLLWHVYALERKCNKKNYILYIYKFISSVYIPARSSMEHECCKIALRISYLPTFLIFTAYTLHLQELVTHVVTIQSGVDRVVRKQNLCRIAYKAISCLNSVLVLNTFPLYNASHVYVWFPTFFSSIC